MEELKKYIQSGSITDVKRYLENDIDQLTLNEALVYACSEKQLDIVQLLLSNGADIHYNSESPLETAIIMFDQKMLEFLISLGADIRNLPENTSSLTIEYCGQSTIEYLIRLGMNLTEDMLEKAAAFGKINSFKLLHSKMPDADLTASWEAAYHNCMKIVEYMLDLPLEFNLKNHTLLTNVVHNRELNLFKKILNRIPDPKSIVDIRILKSACSGGNYEIVKIILELGIDPNDRSDIINEKETDQFNYFQNSTALESALDSELPSYELIKLLLDYGANVTSLCLRAALASGEWNIIHLIYQFGQWSVEELSDGLFDAITMELDEKIWKFLQKEIGYQLKPDYLFRIIDDVLENSYRKIFAYFYNFYGEQALFELVSFGHIINNLIQKKKFVSVEYLLKFYDKETLQGLIHFDKYDAATIEQLEKLGIN